MEDIDILNQVKDDKKKEQILDLSLREGGKVGIGATALSGTAIYFGNKQYKQFREALSISAKVSIPLMIGLVAFSVAFEWTAYDAIVHPDHYTEDFSKKKTNFVGKMPVKMPLQHQLYNYVYDHPFQTIIGLSLPWVGGVVYYQLNKTNLLPTDKFLHARVYSQGGVLAILVATMAFKEMADRHGKYPVPYSEREKTIKDSSSLTKSHRESF